MQVIVFFGKRKGALSLSDTPLPIKAGCIEAVGDVLKFRHFWIFRHLICHLICHLAIG